MPGDNFHMKKLLLLPLLLLSSYGYAQVLIIDCSGFAPANRPACEKARQEALDSLSSAGSPNEYAQGMANAAALSGASTSSIYGTNFNYGLIGFALGTSFDIGSNSISDLASGDVDATSVVGAAANGNLIFGINADRLFSGNLFGVIDSRRLKFFFGILPASYNFDKIDVDFFSISAFAQYKLYESAGQLVGWTGVDVGVGLKYSSLDLSISETINETVSEGGGSADLNATIKAGIEASAINIPMEISTGFRFLHVMKVLVGFGLDWNLGSAQTKDNNPGQDGTITNGGDTATINLNIDADQDADILNFRTFAGLQFELYAVNIFTIGHMSFTNDTVGVSLGAAFYW